MDEGEHTTLFQGSGLNLARCRLGLPGPGEDTEGETTNRYCSSLNL
jgi:hypothetical protein